MFFLEILIFIGLLVLCFFLSRFYNFIHGIISFFGIATLLCFFNYLDWKYTNFPIPSGYSKAIGLVSDHIWVPYCEILDYLHFSFMSNSLELSHYLISIGIFLISFIVSISVRRIRKERAKRREKGLPIE